jgi:two-component system sensor kinase
VIDRYRRNLVRIKDLEKEQALRENEERFRAFVTASTDAVYRMSADWREMRHLQSREFSLETDVETETWLQKYIHPDDRARVMAAIDKAIRTRDTFESEHRVLLADGNLRWTFSRAVPLKDANGVIVEWFGAASDITDRKLAEEALKESQAKLRGIVDSAMDAVISVNEQQRIIVFNRAAEEIFQCGASEAIGSAIDRFIPESLRADHREHIRRFGGEGATARSMTSPATLSGVRCNGEEFPIEATISFLQAHGERIYTVILRDITERKQAEDKLRWSEDQLRALAARLQTAGERERLRIARELHDQMGSVLTGIKMDLDWIVRKHGGGGYVWVPMVEESMKSIDSTIALVRRLATELRPEMLDAVGLGAAIEWYATQFQQRTGISCAAEVPEDRLAISSDQSIALFRIFQEAMTNVARHSQARNVVVSLVREQSNAILTINDDGVGFHVDMLAHTQALGVLGMHGRALLLGAQFSIQSGHAGGTTVTLRMPLQYAGETPKVDHEYIDR